MTNRLDRCIENLTTTQTPGRLGDKDDTRAFHRGQKE